MHIEESQYYASQIGLNQVNGLLSLRRTEKLSQHGEEHGSEIGQTLAKQ